MATLVCSQLKDHVVNYINVEGILIPDPTRSSSKAYEFSSADKFKEFIVEAMLSISQYKDDILYYYAKSLESSNADSLWLWAKDILTLTANNFIVEQFSSLNCKKLYVYGKESFLKKDIDCAKKISDCLSIENATHWPMLENKKSFYSVICNYLIY